MTPKCHYCGAQMKQIARGNSGTSGGGGNRYKCPNSPHPKCEVCKKTMHKAVLRFSGGRPYYASNYSCPLGHVQVRAN